MTTPVWYGTIGILPTPEQRRGTGFFGRARHRLRGLIWPITQALAARPAPRPTPIHDGEAQSAGADPAPSAPSAAPASRD